MNTPNDGGPAFPFPYTQETCSNAPIGMSLRDYFAAQALSGWLASYGPERPHPSSIEVGCEAVAHCSYALADAMIAVRQKGKS